MKCFFSSLFVFLCVALRKAHTPHFEKPHIHTHTFAYQKNNNAKFRAASRMIILEILFVGFAFKCFLYIDYTCIRTFSVINLFLFFLFTIRMCRLKSKTHYYNFCVSFFCYCCCYRCCCLRSTMKENLFFHTFDIGWFFSTCASSNFSFVAIDFQERRCVFFVLLSLIRARRICDRSHKFFWKVFCFFSLALVKSWISPNYLLLQLLWQ